MSNLVNGAMKHVQGFTQPSSSKNMFGHIKKLKIGDKEFAADLNAKGADGKTVQVVGVGEDTYYWDGKPASIHELKIQVSEKSLGEAQTLKASKMDDVTIEIEYEIYKYSQGDGQKEYFKTLWTEGAITGLIKTLGDDIQIHPDDTASTDVENPRNFGLTILFGPEGQKEQQIHFAAYPGGNMALAFGS